MKKPKRINSVSVSLFVLFVLFVYVVWAIVPAMWPLWQMSGMMRTACAVAYREPTEDAVLDALLKEARRSSLEVTKENFIFERVPYSDDELLKVAEAVRPKRLAVGKECRIRFRYVDDYALPLIGTTVRFPYESTVVFDLRPADSSGSLNEMVYSCSCSRVPRSEAR